METTDFTRIEDFAALRRCRKEVEARVAGKGEKVLSDIGEVRKRLTPFNFAVSLFKGAASTFGIGNILLPFIRLLKRKYQDSH